MKLRYYKELDGVRGLAAIMVMFFHFFQGNPLSGNALLNLVQKVSVFGQTGVTLFFVLSGFLITRILLATKEREDFFKIFYLRRSFRIFPLYYLFLFIFYFIIPMLQGQAFSNFGEQWYYWFYLQNLALTFNWASAGPGHFWSLAVEEQFYLIWPLVIFYVNEKYLKRLIYLVIGIAVLSRILLIQNGYGSFYFTLSNIDALVMGAFLAKLERDNKTGAETNRLYYVLICLAFIPTIMLWFFTGGKGFGLIQMVKLSLLAFVYFSFLGIVITSRSSVLSNILMSKPLQYSGKISYGLYVFHPLCFGAIEAYASHINYSSLLVLSFIISYLIASISFFIFELPILKLKNRFEY